MRTRQLLLPALTLLVALGAAPPAQAEFVATGSDPAGDAADPAPGRDIVAFGMSYDRELGKVTGGLRFRGSPEDAPGFVTLALGQRSANGCNGYPAIVLAGGTSSFLASWLRLDTATVLGAKSVANKRGFDSQVQTFEAEAKALAGRRYNCAIATVTSEDDSSARYDSAITRVVGLPSLSVGVRAPKVFPRNRTSTIRFAVSNPGDGPARGVKLRLGKAFGLSIDKRTRTLRTLAPGKRTIVKAKVRFSNKASTSTPLAVKATAGKLVASGKVFLSVKPLPSRPSKGGSGGSRTPQLCNRFQPDLSGQSGGSLVLVPC